MSYYSIWPKENPSPVFVTPPDPPTYSYVGHHGSWQAYIQDHGISIFILLAIFFSIVGLGFLYLGIRELKKQKEEGH